MLWCDVLVNLDRFDVTQRNVPSMEPSEFGWAFWSSLFEWNNDSCRMDCYSTLSWRPFDSNSPDVLRRSMEFGTHRHYWFSCRMKRRSNSYWGPTRRLRIWGRIVVSWWSDIFMQKRDGCTTERERKICSSYRRYDSLIGVAVMLMW